jgi:glycerol-3-phosphate dehydrogenase
MTRDLSQLTARTHDLLVVGGGIYGLTIAYDAAQRGLRVALVERDDFGSGASFNHLRTIHGGLRYLQTLDIGRARESVRERRTLARIAPHSVRPAAFAVPLYRSVRRGRIAMRAGFLLDRMVAYDRNRDVPPPLRLPAGRVLSKADAIERFPGLRRNGLTGAAVMHDYLAVEADRLTFAWALAAVEHHAVLANYVEATELLLDGPRVGGVRAVDRAGSGAIEIAAAITINATGGAINTLAGQGGSPPIPLLKAMNLVTRRDAGDEALGGLSKRGRNLFLVPWRRRALFGTWESTLPCAPGDTSVRQDEVAAFIADLNHAFPSLDLTPDDVTLVHRGAVPARAANGGSLGLDSHEQIIDHATMGHPGLISVAGVKYTTARAVAEKVVDRALTSLHRPAVASRTADTPLPGGTVPDVEAAVADARRMYDERLPSDAVPHLVAAYGSRCALIAELAATTPGAGQRLGDETAVIAAELIWAARHEMVLTLQDAVVRRTPLGALGYPGDAVAQRAAEIVGTELNWDRTRQQREVDALRRFYA